MRTITALLPVLLLAGGPATAADADLREKVSVAANKLGRSGYRWETTLRVEGGGRFSGGDASTNGQVDKDDTMWVSSASSRTRLEFARKGDYSAVLVDGNWMTLDQARERSPTRGRGRGRFGGGFDPRAVTDFKLPARQIEELLGRTLNFAEDGDTVTAELNAEAVSELLDGGARFRGRGGRRGGRAGGGERPPASADAKGTVTFALDDGALTRFTVAVSGSREFFGREQKLSRTTTTVITDIGSTEVELQADAREIVEALKAGRTPDVFVPEPGFKKLFNGRDLTGWTGRPEHWSVRDGAITGISTREKPARGNNFLIATNGDRDLIVDDFELRFAYRIVADNDRGFANSGMQYRSVDRGDHVVAGYQADFEAGDRFSGILYDEGGGAGGRGIMAQRGQSVVWTADGKREVTGSLGDSADIQAAIRKGDWNDYVIIARGNHLQHFINGRQTVDVFDDAEGKRLTSGVLALQIHAGEPMTVQVKDIRIKTLSGVDQNAAGNIRVAKDFKLELLYTVPRETEGSWVALCVDPKGRLITSDQNGKLYRLTPPPVGRSAAIEAQPIDLEIGGAHGLLYAFDSLYVMVNEGRMKHGLYRVRDTDGDDVFDEVKLLRAIEGGGGEHGIHSVILSPDGRSLYVACGDQSRLPEIESSVAPLHWSEDHLLPRLETAFMAGVLAPGGYVLKTDPEGQRWTLIATGFRNEFDIAFNHEGDLFTYDADMEWDIGDPWYRPTRVNHVISGADFGWRNGAGKWPAYYLDSFGAVVDIGTGSPTGLTFGYGARFPAKYQEALYISDWSFGKLYAVHLEPSGGSYTATFDEFISGQPFPVTDVVVSPHDGAMYIVVGGRRTQSGLYRVTYRGADSTATAHSDLPFAAERELRRKLESFHGHSDPKAIDTVWPHLGSTDRSIRHAARIALEWQDPADWRERALNERNPRRAIAAIAALARVTSRDEFHRRADDPPPEPGLQDRMLSSLDAIDWSRLGSGDRLDLLRAYSLTFTRLGRPAETTRRRLIAKFDPLFPAASRELNARLANLLVYLQAPGAAAKIMPLLRAAPTQEEQIDYVLALRVLKEGWTMPLREEYFRWFVETAPAYRGGNTFSSSLRRIREDAIATLDDAEREALKPILQATPERKSLADLLAARPFVKEWTVQELAPIVEAGLAGGRSFERGRRVFGEVACGTCHRFAGDGGGVGPDLTTVVGRFNVHDLLESIVEPSRTISDQYAAIVIVKKNGDTVTGRIANLSGEGVSVVEDMFDPGRMTGVRREDIASMEVSEVSVMPEGLINSLKADEIQDLIAFLLSQGDPQHPMFR